MPLKADSAEFADLLDRWLNDTATTEEAELFWRCVTESRECAVAFGAAARFEGLLADTVKALDVEAEARRVLSVPARRPGSDPITTSHSQPLTSRSAARQVAGQQQLPVRAFAMAAAVILLGLVTAMLWPDAVDTPKVSKTAPNATAPVKPADMLTAPPASTSQAPDAVSVPVSPVSMAAQEPRQAGGPEFVEVPLTTRLDGFWLRGVTLDNVPLGQAMSVLRQLLVEADYRKSLPLDQLQVAVPAGALSRRVTFHSDSIPYLKAVSAVAALAGCEVELADLSITLQLMPGTFPQVAEKRVLADVLAGAVLADGTPMASDAASLTALWNDAARLGIAVAQDGTAQVSRGQMEALTLMAASRNQKDDVELAGFAVYVVPDGQLPQSGVLTPEQTEQLRQSLIDQGIQPVAVIMPDLNPPENTRPLIAATVHGDEVTYSAANAPGVSQTMPIASQESPAGLVLTGRNITLASNAQASGFTAGTTGAVNNITGTLVMLPTKVSSTQVISPGNTSPP
ncbi:hypothetical protein [Brevifollis gellanilyticus]|uniref:Uncharacterized protein n=1 Tax=Brevifollis gellanilyticus TaxID=748831 RepID=A0A512M4A7_9BACT|nr:hypothetical protein [Brevifollis gellanilyticus]GEP41576.1 hypothetical protein BGE01nite_08670 [Brevifollis gellanilyticus]